MSKKRYIVQSHDIETVSKYVGDIKKEVQEEDVVGFTIDAIEKTIVRLNAIIKDIDELKSIVDNKISDLNKLLENYKK